jgi:glycosyltransferase involved in cell wall biosynthesis
MISIIIPTRNKVQELDITLNSIISNSNNISNYEILLGVDYDDLETIEFLNHYSSSNIKVIYFDRQYYSNLHVYYNKLSENAVGDLLWMFADDCKILSKDWDLYLKKYENTFNYVKIKLLECSWDTHFSLIPIIPKKWFDLTGRISEYSQIDGWLWGTAMNLNISVYDENVIVTNFISANADLHAHSYTNSNGDTFDNACDSPELKKDVKSIKEYLKI